MTTTKLFVVEIHGSNACTPYAYSGALHLERGQQGLVSVQDDGALERALYGGDEALLESVALFTSQRQAEAVGLACRWNNQTYSVRPARGRVRRLGQVVDPEKVVWVGCQEDYSERYAS